jgi:hypothetical protein
MKVKYFFHLIFLIFQNDQLIEQTFLFNDSQVFNIEKICQNYKNVLLNISRVAYVAKKTLIRLGAFWPIQL